MTSRLQSIQGLRGLAVLMVVFLHAYAFEEKAGVGEHFISSAIVFLSSGVDLFFVISGFVMVHTTVSLRPSWKEVPHFLLKRALRIYPLYWMFTILLLAVYSSYPNLIRRAELKEVGLLEAFLLLPQKQAPLLVVGWSLIHEVYFYLVFSLLLLIPRRGWYLGLVGWGICICAARYFAGAEPSPTADLVTHPMTLEFILGCFAGLLFGTISPLWSKNILTFGVLLLATLWIATFAFNGAGELSGWQRVIALGVPYGIISAAMASSEGREVRRRTILQVLGDASYSIYLSHFLVISALSRASAMIMSRVPHLVSSIFDNSLFLLAGCALSIVFGLLCHRFVEAPLMRWSQRLLRAVPISRQIAQIN